ncbi:MAG: VCBS repeat-containing protein [Bacteroidetes bacterium]|nr:VCBS repeat-containing protein [Bacteroidota bacterium]
MKLHRKHTYYFLSLLWVSIPILCFSCTSEEHKTNPLFIDKPASETGVTFSNNLQSTPEFNILNYIYYYNGGGIAAGDFNNDGLQDLYFTANQTEDKLYLNKGNFKFSDITQSAGISNVKNWTTGVTTVDINHDGLLDIYVCKLANYKDLSDSNKLYINKGISAEGIPVFKEEAANYQLDFKGFSTQAAFFDYDLDGDLDCFLLNHATNPNQNYGKGSARNIVDATSGDKLFENRAGIFVDVSSEAHILQSKIGYGLGISISDVNNDGFPDIYVGNDFFENDYFYLNNGGKTFSEIITTQTQKIGHTSHFSMGNDIADINNDGYTDILSVDMLPEDLNTYKTSGAEFNYPIYQNYLNNGYSRQYMQNTLQLNNGNESFSEIGYLSGLAATEWSWSPLIADFDNDGYQDVYITNGILGATNDMDFINFIANDNIQKSIGNGMSDQDMTFIAKIPKKKTTNYFFKNDGKLHFKDVSHDWSEAKPTFSNGAVYVDLDNDGDLDIVTNNVNEPATILENQSNLLASNQHWLKIKSIGDSLNPFGIGTTVKVYHKNQIIVRENYTTRGYLSAVPSEMHIGLGNKAVVDSLEISWPDGKKQVFKTLATNQTLEVLHSDATVPKTNTNQPKQYLSKVAPLFSFIHKDNSTIEFNRNPLTAFALSNDGPDISVADINNDGLEDVFMGGAKGQASQLLVQQANGGFVSSQAELFEKDAINEDVAHIFSDVNYDTYIDLLIASGGNEFTSGEPIYPRLYINRDGKFSKDTLFIAGDWAVNASNIKTLDFDGDGDKDVFITSDTPSSLDGQTTTQLLLNQTGPGKHLITSTERIQDFVDRNRVNDMLTLDLLKTTSIITAGDWSPINTYQYKDNGLVYQQLKGLEDTEGFWNVLKAADFDQDGDLDIVAGNWGLNSRLTASKDEPITQYTYDFDDNGSEETVITYFYRGVETTLASKDELAKQMPFINKKYPNYSSFAKASITEIFGDDALKKAKKEQVTELASCYFENRGDGTFLKHYLPTLAQLSSINDIWVEDFNQDGFEDLLLVGNNFEISTQLSSLDALHGLLLLNDNQGGFYQAKGQLFDISGAARNIEKLSFQGDEYLIITRNNDQPVFLRINK